MKGNILEAHVDGKATYVKKHTKYGTFSGKVVLHPEDEDVKSQIDGYDFAERKCDIQALKRKVQFFEQRALGAEHAYNVVINSGVDPDDPIAQKFERQVNVAWINYKKIKEFYLIEKENYSSMIQRLLDYRRQVRSRKFN